MSYTAAQLTAAWTAANGGAEPDAATVVLLEAFAKQTASGQLSDAAALQYVLSAAGKGEDVAVESYQFFTGKTPTRAGAGILAASTATFYFDDRPSRAPTARSLYRKGRR